MSGAITNDYSNNRVQQGPSDSGMKSALDSLPPRPAQIKADDLLGAVVSGSKDLDSNAAGLEFTDFMEFARENWDRLSPEAKELVQTYEKTAKESLAQGQTGIPQDKWDSMVAQMQKIAGVDSSAASAIRDMEKTSGPVSGEQMTGFIEKATSDLDAQAAGTEYHAIMEWAKENSGRLTPEARQVLDRYEAEVRQAQAEGKTGIPQDRYDQMIADMKEIKTYSDAGAGAALDGLANKRGKISGEDMRQAIEQGTKDLDGQAAGTEFHDFMDWAAQNKDRLTPEARQMLDIYEKYARQTQNGDATGISQQDYQKMMGEMKLALAKEQASHQPPYKITGEDYGRADALLRVGGFSDQEIQNILGPRPGGNEGSSSTSGTGGTHNTSNTYGSSTSPSTNSTHSTSASSGTGGSQSAGGTATSSGVTSREQVFANTFAQIEGKEQELLAEMQNEPPDQAKIMKLQQDIEKLYQLLDLLNKLAELQQQLNQKIIDNIRA